MDIVNSVIDYLYELTEKRILIRGLAQDELNVLPVFITSGYSINLTNILEKEYVLLILQKGEIPTPAHAENIIKLVKDALHIQVAFVFNRLDSYDRNRLISKKVPFIIPFQHMFLPQRLIDIREQSANVPKNIHSKSSISDPAQVMLLYYLLNSIQVSDWPLKHWAEKLNYSSMSISRAWKELADMDLCEGEKENRSVYLRFLYSPIDLWNRALPYLHNPIRHRKHVDESFPNMMELRRAGITALSDYTLISNNQRNEYAMRLTDWNAANKQGIINEVPASNEYSVIIETWSYDPKVIALNDDTVDIFSLYLSLQDEIDERIQGALADLIGRYQW